MVLGCEHIVRFVRDNEHKGQICKSSAFKLRVNKQDNYISVDRTCLDSFPNDALDFCKSGSSSSCVVLRVKAVVDLSFTLDQHYFTFRVKPEPSTAKSHGGIYIYMDDSPIVAGQLDIIGSIPQGQERSLLTNGVRQALAGLGTNHIYEINDVISMRKNDQCLKSI